MDAIRSSQPAGQPGGHHSLPDRFLPGLRLLLDACDYARDTSRPRWDFAVGAAALRAAGLDFNDLRWLTCRRLVEHAQEITLARDIERRFQAEGEIVLGKRSHFVLTDAGADCVRSVTGAAAHGSLPRKSGENGNGQALQDPTSPAELPRWNAQLRELRLGSQLVKGFRAPSPNQERILAAFEEEGWPPRIDDPLPPHPEQDSKRRLRDTIKNLNRHQVNHLLQLTCDGTGQGVRWKAIANGGPSQERAPVGGQEADFTSSA